MRVGAGGEFGLEALVGLAVVEAGDALLPCLELHQHLRQIAIRGGAANQRNMGSALENLLAFLLRHAAQHAEALALFLQLLVVGQAVEDLLLGFVANGAGVVEDQPGLFDGGTCRYPWDRSVPTTFSESWTFIWQPKTSR